MISNKDKMENCNEEKEKLRQSIGEIFKELEGDKKDSILSEIDFYKNTIWYGYDFNIDDIIDKIINKRKPYETNQEMKRNAKIIKEKSVARPTRGGRRKKVGKKTRKKKNIKKTRK